MTLSPEQPDFQQPKAVEHEEARRLAEELREIGRRHCPPPERRRLYRAATVLAEQSELLERSEAGGAAWRIIDALITEGVEHWHSVVNDEPALFAWLGLSREEYAAWAEGGPEKLLALSADTQREDG